MNNVEVFTFVKRGNNNPSFDFRNLEEFLEIPVIEAHLNSPYFKKFCFSKNEFGCVVSLNGEFGIGRIEMISDKLKKEIEDFRNN